MCQQRLTHQEELNHNQDEKFIQPEKKRLNPSIRL
ncbi:hypothetical protein HZS_2509, partial [Henneguya salminicola]